MKPSTNQCLGHERLVSTGSSDTKTATVPNGTSAILVTVETTACRATFSSSGDPTSTTGHLIQAAQMPWMLLIGQGTVPRFASTAGTSSVIQLTYLS